MAIIGERIKTLRETHNQSQSELAKILGVSRSTISMVELGKRDLDPDVLEAVADYYNVDMNYLWGVQSESNSHRLVSDDEFRHVMVARTGQDDELTTLIKSFDEETKKFVLAFAKLSPEARKGVLTILDLVHK